MIVDEIKQAGEYFDLGERIQSALRFLMENNLEELSPGRHTIEEEHVFAMVESYQTKSMEAGFWEAHIKHLDVQCVLSGEERLGYAPISALSAGPYDDEKDFYKLEGSGDFITLRPGMFAILKPQDAHMPGIAIRESHQVKKMVIKVRL